MNVKQCDSLEQVRGEIGRMDKQKPAEHAALHPPST
jgi:hypothetical protein